ncbi:signaling threshold-regulating transmembrane adapter 1 isoform X4 [Alligator mississippiensis]|uniref:signaling threshold-regulating transmembrane adapter 1 isoform X4 n=1 Tax=Alligator mississippiensis TaxID=8496 RepID=UPI002877A77C|nr:signaling threshold-regulating transmembrane adapter 1 isoform X4 [Alligator mississippiensis]
MDFCLDGSVFATAGTDRHIRLYDSCTMQPLGPSCSLGLQPLSLLLPQLFHTLEAPDFMTGDVAVTSGHSRRIFALRFHPQENHIFLTGGWDNSVKGHCVLTASWVPRNALQLWDLRMSQLQKNLPFPGGHMQGQFLYAAQFCDPDTVLAGGSGTCGAGVIRISTHQVTQGWSSLPCRQQWSLGIPAECASGPHRVVGVQRGCERG